LLVLAGFPAPEMSVVQEGRSRSGVLNFTFL
jgi:hypothetical protein